jgi:drug/metabolite transporter (DMT)-like permease
MKGLPATVAASLGATQPLFVVLFEKVAHKTFGKIIKDDSFKSKLGAVALVVIGVILLTFSTIKA